MHTGKPPVLWFQYCCNMVMLFLWQKAFKEYVGAVILHKNAATGIYYRDEPTILGWEIANAPVCPGDDTGDLLQVLRVACCAVEGLDVQLHCCTAGAAC